MNSSSASPSNGSDKLVEASGSSPPVPEDNPWRIFLMLLFGCFITIEAAAFQAPALPAIAGYFKVNEDVTALVVLLYYLGLVVFSPIFGRIADRYGRKRVIVYGMSLFAMAEFLAALAPDFTVLLFARFFQGFAVSCILPVILSYVAYLFAPEKRGMPLGFMAFAMSLGATSGAIIGGLIIDHFGWRSIYWVSGGMALVGLVLIAWRIPETPCSPLPYKLDIPGALLLLLSVGTLLSVPTWISKFGFVSLTTLISLMIGLVGFLFLWKLEKKATSPVIDTQLFKNRAFLLPGIIYILFLICHGGSIYALAFFVAGRPDGTAAQVGLVNTFVFASSMAAGLIAGKLLDRFEERSMVIAIIGIMLLGLFLYTTIGISTPLWLIIAIASILGLAQGMKGPTITKLALRAVPREKTGAGSGMFSMMRDFGTPAGVSVGLALFTSTRINATETSLEATAADVGLEPDYLPQLHAAYDAGSIDRFPELGQRLMELGTNLDLLAAPAKTESITTALPIVGAMLIGVIACALVLAALLPKSSSATPATDTTPH